MGLLNRNLSLSRFVLTYPQSLTLCFLEERELFWFLPNNHLVQALAKLEVRIFNQSEQLQKSSTAFCQAVLLSLYGHNDTCICSDFALCADCWETSGPNWGPLFLRRAWDDPCASPVLSSPHSWLYHIVCPLPQLPPCFKYLVSPGALFLLSVLDLLKR